MSKVVLDKIFLHC